MIKQLVSSRIQLNIDLENSGRQVGDLKLKWSDNRQPLGFYPIPIICLACGEGPTVLLIGGVHGDEFEGPAVLMRLVQTLSIDDISGRVIIIPALNADAVLKSSRVSTIDHLNMNRAFPGSADGSPTQMIAHFIEEILIPQCDAVLDLHSGGKASVFAPCALTTIDDSPLGDSNIALAKAFAAPYLWLANSKNDDRSLSAAAGRKQVSMIAAELGGGGGCDPKLTGFAELALKRCLNHLGITNLSIDAEATESEVVTIEEVFTAPASGLLDRGFSVGDKVEVGQLAGWLHFIDEPTRLSMKLVFSTAGIILAHSNRGILERGDLIAIIAIPSDIG